MSMTFTDTQLVLMSAAAHREDHCLVATPTLKGGAAQKVASKLISTGLVKEVKAKSGDPIWRRDAESGAFYALKLTATGAKGSRSMMPSRPRMRARATRSRTVIRQPSRQSWGARTLHPQKGWSLVLQARPLRAAARSSRKSSNCFSAIMAPLSTS